MTRKKREESVDVECDSVLEASLEREIAAIVERNSKESDALIITSNKRTATLLGSDADRNARRPDISRLEDAVTVHDDGKIVPLFQAGARIVIERYSLTIPGKPWLDTQTYEVQSVDPVSGVLQLWNADLRQAAMSNFILGTQNGFIFKLASLRGNSVGKRQRGRPRKNTEKVATIVKAEPQADGEKKRRGRPKGIKNRSKEVIAAERKAKAVERAEKRKLRKSR